MPASRYLHGDIQRAQRDAETLHRYRIMPAGSGFLLWRHEQIGWLAVHNFPTREAAEDYLFNKLPAIESEL